MRSEARWIICAAFLSSLIFIPATASAEDSEDSENSAETEGEAEQETAESTASATPLETLEPETEVPEPETEVPEPETEVPEPEVLAVEEAQFWGPTSPAAESEAGTAAHDEVPTQHDAHGEHDHEEHDDHGESPEASATYSVGHEHEAPGVLRFGSVELSPDLKLYADYQIDVASEDMDNAFHITRAYLGLRVRITPWLMGRVTYDVSQATDIGRAGDAAIEEGEPGEDDTAIVDGSRVQGSMLARLKYAYVSFGIERLSMDIRFGVIHTPWIDWIEHIEDTRFLRKVMIENEYHYPSADFGVALFGNISNYLTYIVGIYNGEGYHGIEDSRFKDFIARLSLRPAPDYRPLTGLQLSGYVQVEFPIPGEEHETHRRFGGALTYRLAEEIISPDCSKVRGDRLALWFQAFYGQEGHGHEIMDSFGFSVGGRVELPARLFLIARLDRFDYDIEHDGDDDILWTVLAAFGFRVVHGVNVALNYQARIGQSGDDRHLIGIHTELHL